MIHLPSSGTTFEPAPANSTGTRNTCVSAAKSDDLTHEEVTVHVRYERTTQSAL